MVWRRRLRDLAYCAEPTGRAAHDPPAPEARVLTDVWPGEWIRIHCRVQVGCTSPKVCKPQSAYASVQARYGNETLRQASDTSLAGDSDDQCARPHPCKRATRQWSVRLGLRTLNYTCVREASVVASGPMARQSPRITHLTSCDSCSASVQGNDHLQLCHDGCSAVPAAGQHTQLAGPLGGGSTHTQNEHMNDLQGQGSHIPDLAADASAAQASPGSPWEAGRGDTDWISPAALPLPRAPTGNPNREISYADLGSLH